MISSRHLIRFLLTFSVMFLLSGKAQADTTFFQGGPALTGEQRANVFAYVKNAWQISEGKAATDVEAHRSWARGQAEAVVKGELEWMVDPVLAKLRHEIKDKLQNVFAQLKQGALFSGQKESSGNLELHQNWAKGQSEDTLRSEIARIVLAGNKAF